MTPSMDQVFNQSDAIVEGWYWALPSSELGKGKVKAVRFLGQDLAVYRGGSGKVVAMDARCPHMGVHLAEGRVEGDGLRCFFHRWKFEGNGKCSDIPALPRPLNVCVATHPVEEKYGLIWIYIGTAPRSPVPFVPELENEDISTLSGGGFVKDCHPHVVMVNAIDAQHFASVHNLPVALDMQSRPLNDRCLLFENTTRIPERGLFKKVLSRFYKGPLTYALSYWYGTNGTVTLGPDFCHFHILFALRPTEDGRTEGRTILITRKTRGLFGPLWNGLKLFLSFAVGKYFAKGDTKIFQTIKFNLKTPIAADAAILRFMQHVRKQPLANWGFARKSPEASPLPKPEPEFSTLGHEG